MNEIANAKAESQTALLDQKPKVEQIAIRMTPEDKKRFTRYCDDNSLSQAEALHQLLDTHDFQVAAEQDPAQAAETHRFQLGLQTLLAIFQNTAMRVHDARDLAREEYAEELEQADQTIRSLRTSNNDLQAEVTAMASEKTQMAEVIKTAAARVSILEDQYKQAQAQLTNHADLAAVLKAKLAEVDSLIAEKEALREREQQQQAEIIELRNSLQKIKLEHVEKLRQQDNDHATQLRAAEADKHRALEALARAEAKLAILQAEPSEANN